MWYEDVLLAHETAIRIGFFVATFLAVGVWELMRPQRKLVVPKRLRWVANLSLAALNTLVLRLVLPIGAVAFATLAAAKGWGILNLLETPAWLAGPLAVVALDFVIWLQHRVFHAVPALWRLHQVHHADLDYDLTTGSRFHAIEMVLSMLVKLVAIALIGAPAVAVLIFEVLLSSAALFNHGNIRLPAGVDQVLRWFIVTPDMHRVHHSVDMDETNSNFGFNLSWWDRALGTYRAQPRAGQLGMTIGLNGHTSWPDVVRIDGLLRMPFRRLRATRPM